MWKTKQATCSITLLTVIFISLLMFLCPFHFIFTTSLLMICVFQTFHVWILLQFPCISGWASVPTYIEDMSRATAFAPLRGNQTLESFKVYLDRLVAKDMHFNSYVDHRETRPFDEIVIYSRWLACESRLTAPHFLERVMRQFDYTQIILKHPIVFAPPTLTRK